MWLRLSCTLLGALGKVAAVCIQESWALSQADALGTNQNCQSHIASGHRQQVSFVFSFTHLAWRSLHEICF